MQIHPLIETSAALVEFVDLIKTSDFVAVDTEFMRENTFWPELCLIQVADSDHAAAIDPMAPGMDLKPLLDLLVDNEDVLKVFHAGGQDIGQRSGDLLRAARGGLLVVVLQQVAVVLGQ